MRMSTLVLTLLTFCPPAPPLLAKLNFTSSVKQGKPLTAVAKEQLHDNDIQ